MVKELIVIKSGKKMISRTLLYEINIVADSGNFSILLLVNSPRLLSEYSSAKILGASQGSETIVDDKYSNRKVYNKVLDKDYNYGRIKCL